MLVAIDASRLEPINKTGVEYYSQRLLNSLTQVIPDDVRVILYSRQDVKGELTSWPKNWENKVLKWPLKYLWSQLRLPLAVFFDKPDVTFIPSHLVPFLLTGKVVVTIHDISWRLAKDSYSLLSYWYLKLMTWWSVFRAVAIITISNYSKSQIATYYKKAKNKIFTIYLAAALKGESSVVEGIRAPYFLYIGRIEKKKNLLTLIRAFKKIDNSSLSLIMVGKNGVGASEILKEAADDSRVKLLGWLDESKTIYLLKNATALVFPANYEGFGIPVLEAWSAGVPVISAAAAALPEIVAQGGLLVSEYDIEGFTNAMNTLLTNDNLRKRLIENGRQRLQDFNWDKTAQETWRVLSLVSTEATVSTQTKVNNFDQYE